MKHLQLAKKYLASLFTAALLACLGQVNSVSAAVLSINDSPLFLLTAVDPNIMFTYDDSGSMSWGYMPDSISGDRNSRRGCSKTWNAMAYDPSVLYDPPVDANNTSLELTYTPTSFTQAYFNGYNRTATVNLSANYQVKWDVNTAGTGFQSNNAIPGNGGTADTGTCGTATSAGQAAYYTVYDTTLASCTPVATSTNGCYRIVTVSTTSGTGPAGPDERLNFARWYSYYSNRTLVAKSGAGHAFAQLSDTFRLGYQRLNTCNTGFGIAPTAACPGSVVKPFTGTARTDFFTWLYSAPANNGTPLRSAFNRAGSYISNATVNGPYALNPGTTLNPQYSCRQNFHLAFTDGLWNTDTAAQTGNFGNIDNAAFAFPAPANPPVDGDYPYVANYAPGGTNQMIYPDTNLNSLGDIAFRYWSRDARPDLANDVPYFVPHSIGDNNNPSDNNANFFNPDNDPAVWQHLVNYTIGLGVTGTRNPANYFDSSLPASAGDYDELLNGTLSWPATANDSINNVDDLWHAAVNSRGRYFSAGNPTSLLNSLNEIFNNIGAHTGSAAALAANAGSVGSNTRVYQAKFRSGFWSGQLLALNIDPATGAVNTTTPAWDAANRLNQRNYDSGRTIITYNPTLQDGAAFRWPNIDANQQASLAKNPSTGSGDPYGQDRLNYLRGQSIYEGVTPQNFRSRVCPDPISGVPKASACTANNGKLGDMVNSAPLYVEKPPYYYSDTLESKPYSAFVTAHQTRTPMVYVGANDGMLHGIDGNTGDELLAYVPNLVYANLSLLTASNYTHRYFVDGSPTAGDVFINIPGVTTGQDWRTVLVGGLRKGGRGYYALDITNPASFSETNASSMVLWEFTDPDLGYTYSQPSIVKMANGKWAAVFGNGYNNVSPGNGHAILYIVFIENGIDGTWTLGTDFIKIDTTVGSTVTPNGLATPAAIDVNRDFIVDYIYAGDLLGNMWKFDVRSATPSDWSLATKRSVLFTTNVGQPITTRPIVGRHPMGGRLVYFGTGKYLEAVDNNITGAVTQSFYAIWDQGTSATVPRTDLLQQQIEVIRQRNGWDLRVVTDTPINWRTASASPPSHLGWYLDLTGGEKQITNSILREGRIIFTTYIPSATPCNPGGDGWLMELDSLNGGRLSDTFDTDTTAGIGASDRVTPLTGGPADVAASGIKTTVATGAPSEPVIVQGLPGTGAPQRTCVEYKYSSTTDGRVIRMQEACSATRVRESWQQLK